MALILPRIVCWTGLYWGLASTVALAKDVGIAPEQAEFFEKRVRPILAQHCFSCHGSASKHKGNLRLDSRAGLLLGGDTGPAIAVGEPARSLLIKAIGYHDPDLRMPPKNMLPDQAIADLTAWIQNGAAWPEDGPAPAGSSGGFSIQERKRHWAFQPLRLAQGDLRSGRVARSGDRAATDGLKPALRTAGDRATTGGEDRLKPALRTGGDRVTNAGWARTRVDAFILAGLEAKGLTPARPADKRTLLRRVTYDLIGLPPTPAEIDAFLADTTPQAYVTVVERLLASPHYGERWARHWLDLVRFAETCGHEFDFDIPEAYEYRDYVIRAFNDDVPYNQFVIEHVAGDLLNPPRRHASALFNESIIGSGFFYLGEAKHSPVDVSEDEAERIDNQIDVLGKAFLGLTIACARCHDHKFDAISTKDYYALSGYLHSSRYQRAVIDPPAKYDSHLQRVRILEERIRPLAVEVTCRTLRDRVDKQLPWPLTADMKPADFLERRQKLLKDLTKQAREAEEFRRRAIIFADFEKSGYQDWFVTGTAFGTGPSRTGNVLLQADANHPVHSILPAGVATSGLRGYGFQGVLRSKTFTIQKKKIWYHVAGRQCLINLIIEGYQKIRDPIYGGLTLPVDGGDTFTWRDQDVAMWQGRKAYIEILDEGPGHIAIDQILFADNELPRPGPNPLLVKLLEDASIISPEAYTHKYRKLIGDILNQWRTDCWPNGAESRQRIALLNDLLGQDGVKHDKNKAVPPIPETIRLRDLCRRLQDAEKEIPSPRLVLAMADGTGENDCVHIRGSHKNLGQEVPRRFLEAISGGDQAAPVKGSGRLNLAGRLVDPANALLPRVLVNRLWQHHFGQGIVRSPDNFGVLGEAPSHPELLDYLAGELVRRGWSIKDLHRLMLLSRTYQMASRASPEALKADPQNIWLQHMPVRRLEAEAIRDALLAVSGRLDDRLYGPGVMPHLTPFMAGRGKPAHSGPVDGDGRRSIYITVRRNFLTPLFLAFDYPIPFTTMGKRSVSNVPAQALALMNNPLVLDQAKMWAERTLRVPKQEFGNQTQQSVEANGNQTPANETAEDRLARMYVQAFGRPPSVSEQAEALAFVRAQTETSHSESLAWRDLAHVLVNCKEFIFIE